jgi:GNAT superfamily N-acetyltransferase/2'-5' RNA ligase
MAESVRHARIGDGAAIARIHIETWQRAYRGQLPDEFLDRLSDDLERRSAWWERQIADAPNRRWRQLVAEDNEGIVGFATCGPSEGEGADPWIGEVYAIYVHPRGWDCGFGRQLFARALDVLRPLGYREAVLWVLDTNARARRFYEIAGWRTDGAAKTDRRGDVVLREVRYRTALASEGSTVPRNSYVLLDLPTPVAEQVLAIRKRQRDFFHWSLPAETTVIGSSGLGSIATDEEPAHVFRTIDRVAAETPPIRATLGPVRRFPSSDVFYLSFVDEAPLRALHERLAATGLRFSPAAFPFTPHVTLRTAAATDEEAAALLTSRVSGEFTLETLSLYQLVWRAPPTDRFQTLLCLLHRARLTGNPSSPMPR